MGFFSHLSHSIKRALGVPHIKQQAQDIRNLASSVISVPISGKKETFEEAVRRMQLDESQIATRKSTFERTGKILIFICLLLLVYLIFNLIKGNIIASLGTAGILLVMIGQSFRAFFWAFQIQQRRLGCTFKEWMAYLRGKSV